ncbi:helix-turn-helix and ligand-binding sensor domain-containing protein [Saccharicrinis fermentans]|uniref:Y_Y_Y domain protein n=1 Tax=Saccharicrinis fermentans DSM 9555 = JCM 21142 TaxID=869213 RepID=W7YJQ7_9BACT|nr:triple tyrosine motif-containing protein [Saccharicrinis fermentans]GAF02564.1 Y_Y_Y domain protein [Saccharicrinis fermentans DSM 9555 = JCM 21142]
MKITYYITIVTLILSYSGSFGRNTSLEPFVINYNRSEYKAMSQNWAVAFDDIGRAYFGNSGGVLEFDGNNWLLHQHKSKSAIRSLFFDKDSKRLYSGCYEDFGYWKRDSLGVLSYTSLADQLPSFSFSGERIWSIVKYKHEILFQSFRSIFTYNTLNKEVKFIDPAGEILFLNLVHNKVYTWVSGRGIVSYDQGKFTTINDSKITLQSSIRFFLPNPRGIIVGEGKTGLHILKDGILKPWHCEANHVLKSLDVNSALVIDSSTYAIGTLKGGLYLINDDGIILKHLDRQSKLENNTVLGMNTDPSGDLWLAMDNGISHIDLNSPVHYNIDLDYAPSAIYSVIEHHDYVYVGTNNGVFYARFQHNLAQLNFQDLKPLTGIYGHIWKLDILNNELLCGNNDGIYKINKGTAKALSISSGGTDFKTFHHGGEEWLMESTYYKIRLHKRENQQWVFSHFVDGFQGSCRFIEMDHAGYIWISHEIKGLYRIQLSDDLRSAVSIDSFGIKNGLPTDYGLNVFKINNRVVVTTGEEIYTYDDLNDKMLPYNKLNKALGRFKQAVRIINADRNLFWVITANEAALVQNNADSTIIKQTLTLNRPYSFPDKYQNISINDKASVLCLENGIAVLPINNIDSSMHLPLVISAINNPERGRNTKKLLTLKSDTPIQLKNKNNSLEFSLTAVNFGPNKVNYQYRVVNLLDAWIDNRTENAITINDIPAGKYTFQAMAVYSDGKSSKIVEYPFEVLQPWYASRTGILSMIAIMIGSIVFLLLFNHRLIKLRTSEIEQKHEDQHKQNKSTIAQLREDVLKKELENLQGKLTVSANALVEKDKSIKTIKNELHQIYKKLEGRFPQRDYHKIVKVIDSQMTQKRDMLNFEQHFAASQSGFYDKLKQKHPGLSPADLRLCSLLKMNMNSKEIAVLLGITVRSVEVSRYRLRKKMGLKAEENLTSKIMEF